MLLFFCGIVLPLVLLAAAGAWSASAVVRWEARLTGEPDPGALLPSWTSRLRSSRSHAGVRRVRSLWSGRGPAGAVGHHGAHG